MTPSKLRKGDKVLVIAGKDRGKTGVIERIFPAKNRAVITGINMLKKHLKRSAKNPQGGVVDVTASIHLSNIMLLDPTQNKPTRISYRLQGQTKERISRISQEVIRSEK